MTKKQRNFEAIRFVFATLCGAIFLYFLVCAAYEAMSPKAEKSWLHPRIAVSIACLLGSFISMTWMEIVPQVPERKVDDDRT